jgi:hypothetical protein
MLLQCYKPHKYWAFGPALSHQQSAKPKATAAPDSLPLIDAENADPKSLNGR